jgi:hypothetical protein
MINPIDIQNAATLASTQAQPLINNDAVVPLVITAGLTLATVLTTQIFMNSRAVKQQERDRNIKDTVEPTRDQKANVLECTKKILAKTNPLWTVTPKPAGAKLVEIKNDLFDAASGIETHIATGVDDDKLENDSRQLINDATINLIEAYLEALNSSASAANRDALIADMQRRRTFFKNIMNSFDNACKDYCNYYQDGKKRKHRKFDSMFRKRLLNTMNFSKAKARDWIICESIDPKTEQHIDIESFNEDTKANEKKKFSLPNIFKRKKKEEDLFVSK